MKKDQKIKIMMAEDHQSARQAYVALLREEHNFVVTGHAGNGYDLLKLIEESEPDIVLTDLDMPVMDGSKLIEVLKVRFPKVKPIVLSMYNEAEYISQMIINGACAYIPKNSDFDEVVLTINKVFSDGYYFNNVITGIIMSARSGKLGRDMRLSPREIDVLKLICLEQSNKDIAQALGLSINTVAYYRKQIFDKTNAGSVIGLYRYAVKNGIIED